ncbi:Glyoxalase/Bleomycin resistance protein/Dihydroxybiphenyl dioxygenase [Hesseltinella vesiculosa]|uniref:Glyoxalase/Bleomycin resistance protein/Dihydroxybiphenyl dioxygenase n=1 Tax=Hesseltinella vesiculosa TaxID=101127 RepID=A0A1X2GEV7_9FUNG|nr:Glyoxalase/Bleomycin resistance protein/Dihydroxybiphenyl dioxygenase [Hesseltinella vesiculosa]
MGTLSHISLSVKDFEKSKAFYNELMQVLGREKSHEIPGNFCAWGQWAFGIHSSCSEDKVTKNAHIGLAADSRELVDAFHAKALSLGATCNGKPGLRPWAEGYYAAFFHDLDGNNIEVVHFEHFEYKGPEAEVDKE